MGPSVHTRIRLRENKVCFRYKNSNVATKFSGEHVDHVDNEVKSFLQKLKRKGGGLHLINACLNSGSKAVLHT